MKPDFDKMPSDLLSEVQQTMAINRQACPAVYRFEANRLGRDFIVGDIHGAFELVRHAMRAVKFDQTKDRLFSCGDLIDRGTQSSAAALFLDAPFAHAVMGNHEADLIELYSELRAEDGEHKEIGIQALAKINWNGMRWLAETGAHDRARVLRAISKLPLAIEVETSRGIVGIIHGEVPLGMDWATFRQGLLEGTPSIVESCLSGRKRHALGNHDLIKGIDRVFCGHTPQFDGARRLGNVFFVDTGAVFGQLDRTKDDHPGASLTMAQLTFKTGDLLSPQNVDHPTNKVRLLSAPRDNSPFNSSWINTGCTPNEPEQVDQP